VSTDVNVRVLFRGSYVYWVEKLSDECNAVVFFVLSKRHLQPVLTSVRETNSLTLYFPVEY
jgi:hypothetical protein